MQGKTSLSENAFEARLGGDGQKHRAPSSIGRRLLELGIWILELGISISSIENESLDRRVNSTTHFQSRPGFLEPIDGSFEVSGASCRVAVSLRDFTAAFARVMDGSRL